MILSYPGRPAIRPARAAGPTAITLGALLSAPTGRTPPVRLSTGGARGVLYLPDHAAGFALDLRTSTDTPGVTLPPGGAHVWDSPPDAVYVQCAAREGTWHHDRNEPGEGWAPWDGITQDEQEPVRGFGTDAAPPLRATDVVRLLFCDAPLALPEPRRGSLVVPAMYSSDTPGWLASLQSVSAVWATFARLWDLGTVCPVGLARRFGGVRLVLPAWRSWAGTTVDQLAPRLMSSAQEYGLCCRIGTTLDFGGVGHAFLRASVGLGQPLSAMRVWTDPQPGGAFYLTPAARGGALLAAHYLLEPESNEEGQWRARGAHAPAVAGADAVTVHGAAGEYRSLVLPAGAGQSGRCTVACTAASAGPVCVQAWDCDRMANLAGAGAVGPPVWVAPGGVAECPAPRVHGSVAWAYSDDGAAVPTYRVEGWVE